VSLLRVHSLQSCHSPPPHIPLEDVEYVDELIRAPFLASAHFFIFIFLTCFHSFPDSSARDRISAVRFEARLALKLRRKQSTEVKSASSVRHISVLLSRFCNRIWCNGQHCRLSRGSSGFDSPYPNAFCSICKCHHGARSMAPIWTYQLAAERCNVPEEFRVAYTSGRTEQRWHA
jgi:hypothetical protein